MYELIARSQLPSELDKVSDRLMKNSTDMQPTWRVFAVLNEACGRQRSYYVRRDQETIFFSHRLTAEWGPCYMSDECNAPGITVKLSYRDEEDSVRLKLCGPHARETRWLGFEVKARNGVMNVKGLLPDIERYAESMPNLSSVSWTEVQEAPRDWCAYGCKIHAARHPGGVSVWLRHSRTYGCPLGV
ncbi:hypothetical protein ACFQ61_08125 [Streptomyces sp. NPDC056500]|uniref:hypothetical protein n=1 Tax=Streptomyces sp. NPDC056500 TaxID=3345840 RepID=UPI0036900EAE